jgi:recombination protein RecA
MLYGEGISRTGEILDFGVEMDLIKKAGAFYSYKEVRIGQGRDNARQYILEHPVIFDELDTAIREKMIATPIPAPVIADNEEAPSEDDVEFVLDDDISEEELEAAV